MLRRENGEKTQLKLLGIGLHRYLDAEEGIATLREMSMKEDEFDVIGKIGLYLGIVLALGMDGKKRNFREIFDILTDYNLITTSNDLTKSKEIAYNNTIRIFRGTNCKDKGICFSKDASYVEGRLRIARFIKENRTNIENITELFNIGKFDPTNFQHLYILYTLGILQEEKLNLII